MSDVSSSLYSTYQTAQWWLFVDLLSRNLDNLPEETFMLVPADKYSQEYAQPAGENVAT